MSNHYAELIQEARRLPRHSVLRLPILEEAVREADRLGDEDLGYRARMELVTTATFSGNEDRALVAFSWCLAFFDRAGENFEYSRHSLLWAYKWIADNVVQFPAIDREQIVSMETDLRQRLEHAGYGLRPWLKIRWSNADFMGDTEIAAEFYEEWCRTPHGGLSDCRACDVDSMVDFEIGRGNFDRAMEHADPLLGGELGCATVPQTTYGSVLEPLALSGRDEEADRYQRRGYRQCSRDRNLLSTIGEHMEYLVRTEAWDRALRMVERHHTWSLETRVASTAYNFDKAAWMVFAGLAARGDRPRKLRLSGDFPERSEDDRYRPSALAAFYESRARDVARRFDVRNGNDSFARGLAATREFCRVDV